MCVYEQVAGFRRALCSRRMTEGQTAVAEGEATREADAAAPPRASRTVRARASTPPGVALDGICPFLIAATGDWRLAAPTREHRCAAFVPLTSLAIDKQARLCLTSQHTSCATFKASVTARATLAGTGEPVERVGRWGFARTTPLIEDTGGLRGTLITMIGDRRTWPAIPAVLLVATLIAVGISGIRGEGPAVALASPSPSPAAAGSLAPEPTLDATPDATVEGTPEVSVAPPPSVVPTAVPSFQLYTVQSGDSLSLIATKFHTTISAIEQLNNISDPRKLHVGQVLKIP